MCMCAYFSRSHLQVARPVARRLCLRGRHTSHPPFCTRTGPIPSRHTFECGLVAWMCKSMCKSMCVCPCVSPCVSPCVCQVVARGGDLLDVWERLSPLGAVSVFALYPVYLLAVSLCLSSLLQSVLDVPDGVTRWRDRCMGVGSNKNFPHGWTWSGSAR